MLSHDVVVNPPPLIGDDRFDRDLTLNDWSGLAVFELGLRVPAGSHLSSTRPAPCSIALSSVCRKPFTDIYVPCLGFSAEWSMLVPSLILPQRRPPASPP